MKRKQILLAIGGLLFLIWLLMILTGCNSIGGRRDLFVPVATNEQGAVSYQVNPGVTNALGTGQQIGEQVPAPWGTVITGALGVTSALLGWLAKRKSDQAAVIPALIAGIELAKNNGEVKTSIQRIATATGVEKQLNKMVHKSDSAEAARHFGK